MSAGQPPFRPEPGWQTRWPLQAGALLLRMPLQIACLGGLFLVLGLLEAWIFQAVRGFFGAVLLLSALSCLGAVLVGLLVVLLLEADGGNRPSSDALKASDGYLAAVFLVTSAFLTLSLVIFVLPAVAAGMPPPLARPVQDPASETLWAGVRLGLNAIMAGIVVNPLWAVLVPALGLGLREASAGARGMLIRMPDVLLPILFITVIACIGATRLPAILSFGALIALVAWLYVAAREIFAGIGRNAPANGARTALEA